MSSLWFPAIVHVAIYTVLAQRLWTFTSTHRRIDTPADILAYRRFVSGQMVGTLAMMGNLAVIVVMMATTKASGFVDYWLPVTPVVGLGLLTKLVQPLERKARALPATPWVRAHYEEVSSIWQAKAWPSFPPIPEHRAAVEAPGRPGQVTNCEKHGRGVAAFSCTRCKGPACQACTTGRLVQSLCNACHAALEQLRTATWPREAQVRMLGVFLSGYGLVDFYAGLEALTDPRYPEKVVPVLAMFVGMVTGVVGVSVTTMHARARSWAAVVASAHFLAPPIGTVGAVATLIWLYGGGPVVLSPQHAELISLTEHRGYRPLWVATALSLLGIPLYAANVAFLLTW